MRMISGNIPNEAICRRISVLLKSGALRKHDRWLDVGCGAGAHASLATDWFPNYGLSQYTGIDIDAEAVAFCRGRFRPYPLMKFEKCGFESYHSLDGFKLIVDCFSIAYCKEREAAVAHIGKLLRSDGHYLGVWPGNNQFDAPMLSAGFISETFGVIGKVEYMALMEGAKAWWLIHAQR